MRLRRPHVDTGELEENWQPRLYVGLILLAALIAYSIAFVLENRQHVHVHFVFWTATVSLIWLLLLGIGIGLLGGILAAQLARRRRRRRTAQ